MIDAILVRQCVYIEKSAMFYDLGRNVVTTYNTNVATLHTQRNRSEEFELS